MMDLHSFEESIEVERTASKQKLAALYGILDARTLSKSQDLDLIINRYNKLIKKEKPTA